MEVEVTQMEIFGMEIQQDFEDFYIRKMYKYYMYLKTHLKIYTYYAYKKLNYYFFMKMKNINLYSK